MPGYPRPARVRAVHLTDVAVTAGARLVAASDVGSPTAASDVGSPATDLMVTGITHDSSAVRPGDLYAALRGARRHGAEFAEEAICNGAVAVLTDEQGAALIASTRGAGVPLLVVDDARSVLGGVSSYVYGDPTHRLSVVGITGTAGKTSTAYLVESGLRAAGQVTCLVGTVETRVAGTVVDSVRTTPEATDLHALFAAAVEQGAGAAVIEVSSHALVYGRVEGVRFRVGGYTNFGQDHLDFHGDADAYFAAKARLFDGRCEREVVNLDDEAVRALVRADSVTYSASGDPRASWHATDVVRDGTGQRFTAHGPGGVLVPASVALPGTHNVANALLAIACLVELGIDAAAAADGVAACRGVPGRLEVVDAPGSVLGVVDYAHKPDAIVAALRALREIGSRRLICVLGAGGDRDRAKREQMGAAAARYGDIVIITDDNPRSEEPGPIRAQVRAGAVGVGGAATVIEVPGRRDAIAEAVALAEPGDVVALLGKGHETGQEVSGVCHPFDDRIELAAALSARFTGVRA